MDTQAWIEIIVPNAMTLLGLYLTHRKQTANPIENQPRPYIHPGAATRSSRRVGMAVGVVGIVISFSFFVYNLIYPPDRPRLLMILTIIFTVCFAVNLRLVQSWNRTHVLTRR